MIEYYFTCVRNGIITPEKVLLMLCLFSPVCFSDGHIENIHTPPGKMVDIGTHRLHFNCVGENKPAVIFDSGLGGFSLDWLRVQEALQDRIMSCAYDRAGYGWSDHGPSPRVTEQIVDELHSALEKLEIEPPYILVGHSFGGYTAQYFSKLYPQLTAGLVLVESSHPEQASRMPDMPAARQRSGNSRMVTMLDPSFIKNYPESYQQLARQILSTEKYIFAQRREYLNFTQSGVEVAQVNRKLDVPLAVITRGEKVWEQTPYGEQQDIIWMELQKELLLLSSDSWQVIAEKSGHLVHFQQPDLVAETVLSVARRYCHQQKDKSYNNPQHFCHLQ